MNLRLLYALLLLPSLWLMSCSQAPQLPPIPTDGVILAFGDSLTYGTGAPRDKSYPADLARLSGRRVINAGVPGETSAAGLARLPGVLDKTHPSLLILCHGGNDMLQRLNLENTAANIRAMINDARRHEIPVMLIGVPKPGILLETAGFYKTIARDMHVPIEATTLPRILRNGSLKTDYVHPNANGYRMLANAVFALLKKDGAL